MQTYVAEYDAIFSWRYFYVRFNIAKIVRRQDNGLWFLNKLKVTESGQLQSAVL